MTPALPPVTETQFQAQVIALARLRGWRCVHFRPGLTRGGAWRTAVQGDGAGFPDLILVRERVIHAELKTDRGRVAPEQAAWADALRAAGQDVRLWRPSNWPEIEAALA